MAYTRVNNFLVGCDPEFGMIEPTTNRIVNVGHFFGRRGEVGYDHGGTCVEFRPRPSHSTFRLVKRMHALQSHPRLQLLQSKKWRAGARIRNGSNGYSVYLGGHVHLGLTLFTVFDPNSCRDTASTLEGKQILAALDCVTKIFDKLELVPPEEIESRTRAGWGRLSNFRTDIPNRLEYRSMPSWLQSPEIAFIALTGAKLAAAAPSITTDLLQRATSYTALKTFFEAFQHRDTDARRVVEEILDAKSLREIQCDYDLDFKPEWEKATWL